MFVFVGLVAMAAGPSFNCQRATTPTERMVCADPALSTLDSNLAEAWKVATKALSSQKTALRDSQRRWITRRDACADAGCLTREYSTRTAWLLGLVGRQGGSDTNRTGRYQRDDSRLDVLERDGVIRFQLFAFWHGMNPDNIHIGELAGDAPLARDVAVVRADACLLTLTFSNDKVQIEQSGADIDCGFGANVSADGLWTRTDRRAPLLDPDDM